MNHHYIQLAYQLADSVSGFAYSFGGTCIILFVMNFIPGLSLRASEDEEINGIDDAEIGEFAVCSIPLAFSCSHQMVIFCFFKFLQIACMLTAPFRTHSMTLSNINAIISMAISATVAVHRGKKSRFIHKPNLYPFKR